MAISYRPLNVERLEVRLLKIFPVPYDPDGSAIQSSLETASLLDQPDYCALSYCWGTSPLTASIEIDGRPFGVTDSLEAALKQLRRNRQSSLSLWVDFLCINQADKVEKASQVQLMDRIYGRASKVFAWLGSSGPYATFVLDIFRDIADGNVIGHRMLPSVRALLARVVRDFAGNPYWKRVWIIQELAKPLDLTILWGTNELTWDFLSLVTATKTFESLVSTAEFKCFATLQAFRSREQNINVAPSRISLFGALVQTQCAEATDPRDKVIALLNLTNDGKDVLPFPNYLQSLDQMYSDVASALIVRQQRVSAIQMGRPRAVANSGLPSWVPDWSVSEIFDLGGYAPIYPKKTDATARYKIIENDGKLTLPCSFGSEIAAAFPGAMEIIRSGSRNDRRYTELSLRWTSPTIFRDRLTINQSTGNHFTIEATELFTNFCLFIGAGQNHSLHQGAKVSGSAESALYVLLKAFDHKVQTPAEGKKAVRSMLSSFIDEKYYLALTTAGTFRIVCGDIIPGDHVVQLPNCVTPVILRKHGSYFRYVGRVCRHAFDRPPTIKDLSTVITLE